MSDPEEQQTPPESPRSMSPSVPPPQSAGSPAFEEQVDYSSSEEGGTSQGKELMYNVIPNKNEVIITYPFRYSLDELLRETEAGQILPPGVAQGSRPSLLTAILSEAAIHNIFGDNVDYIYPICVELVSMTNDSKWMYIGKIPWLQHAHKIAATSFGHVGHFTVLPMAMPLVKVGKVLESQEVPPKSLNECLLGETMTSLEQKYVDKTDVVVHIGRGKLAELFGLPLEVDAKIYSHKYEDTIRSNLVNVKANTIDIHHTGLEVCLAPCVGETKDLASAVKVMATRLSKEELEFERTQEHMITITLCLKFIAYGTHQ
jgi:hypothetical protein